MIIQEAISALTFDQELGDSEMVGGAIVLLHLIRKEDGAAEGLFIATSEGIGEVTQIGMVSMAERIVNQSREDEDR